MLHSCCKSVNFHYAFSNKTMTQGVENSMESIARDYGALAVALRRSTTDGVTHQHPGHERSSPRSTALKRRCEAGLVGDLVSALRRQTAATTTFAQLDSKGIRRGLRIPLFSVTLAAVVAVVLVLL